MVNKTVRLKDKDGNILYPLASGILNVSSAFDLGSGLAFQIRNMFGIYNITFFGNVSVIPDGEQTFNGLIPSDYRPQNPVTFACLLTSGNIQLNPADYQIWIILDELGNIHLKTKGINSTVTCSCNVTWLQ